MITLNPSQNRLAACCLVSLIFIFSGCVSVGLEKKFPDIKTYSLDLNAGHLASFAGTPVSVQINPFSAAPFFEDRYLAYRSGETAYEQDFYNQLITSPAKMIQDEVSVWLKGSPLVSVLVTPEAAPGADYTIDGRVIELSGDYRMESDPKAVVRLQLTVSGDPGVLLQKIYTAEIPMERISPVVLTQGWSRGFDQIVKRFEADLAVSLATAAQASE